MTYPPIVGRHDLFIVAACCAAILLIGAWRATRCR